MVWRDRISGGLADKDKPRDFSPEELARGRRVEKEHSSSANVQKEIAMDHLKEDPWYYKKLEALHGTPISFVMRILRAYRENSGKEEKTASIAASAARKLPKIMIGTAIGTGAATGAYNSPKGEKTKGALRGSLYGAAAAIGSTDRIMAAQEARLERLFRQRTLLKKIKHYAKHKEHMEPEIRHWERLTREDRPKTVASALLGGGAGTGLAELGNTVRKRIMEQDADKSQRPKKKRVPIPMYIR